jgi:uncharacterized membrane protein
MVGRSASRKDVSGSERTLTTLAGLVATLASGLFAGAAVHINLVEHPARMQTGTGPALRVFAPSVTRATVTQVTLIVTGFLGSLAAWRASSDARWLIGGGLLMWIIPFTVLAVLPINKRLLDPETVNDLDLAEDLLRRWGRLHAVRSVSGLASLLTFLLLLAERKGTTSR